MGTKNLSSLSESWGFPKGGLVPLWRRTEICKEVF